MMLGELFDNIKIGPAVLIIHCPQVNTCNSRQIIESISDMSLCTHYIYCKSIIIIIIISIIIINYS